MRARQPWLFCLSTILGSTLTLTACSNEDEPPVGGVGSGSLSAGATTSSNSSSTTDDTGDTTGVVGDGDGDSTGVGDGDGIGDGDGDSGIPTTGGDGDSTTGSMSWQECESFYQAGSGCGVPDESLLPVFGACEDSFEIGSLEQGECMFALVNYWVCRSELTCSDFFFQDSGSDVCLEAHGPDTACADDSWLP